MKLLLVTLFLSSNLLSINVDTIEYKQLENIHRIQDNYIELLWLYMLEKYGHIRAVKLYTKIITKVLWLQSVIYQIDSIIRLNDDKQHVDALLKTILQLT